MGIRYSGKTAKQVQIGDMIIDKPSFGSMELAKAAMENNYEKIELVGLVSNICVLTNAAVLKNSPAARGGDNCGCGLYREL